MKHKITITKHSVQILENEFSFSNPTEELEIKFL